MSSHCKVVHGLGLFYNAVLRGIFRDVICSMDDGILSYILLTAVFETRNAT